MMRCSDRAVFPDPSDLKEGHYVYTLSDSDDVFYVGKGCNNRYRHHFYNCNLKDRTHKSNKILSINNSGRKVTVNIIASNLSERDALSLEGNLIASYGISSEGGSLTNLQYGDVNKITGKWSKSRKEEYARKMAARVPEDVKKLVHKARHLHYYRGLGNHDILDLPEFKSESISKETLHRWLSRKRHKDVAPLIPSSSELRREKIHMCHMLRGRGFSSLQISGITGLPLTSVRRYLKAAIA